MAKRNIPIFIPHSGCRHDCAFCDQKSITGKAVPPTFSEAEKIIGEHMKTLSSQKPQIAFFGGSFTGIDPYLMEGYLKVAYKYVENGLSEGIRLSTRPDYIDENILDILEKYAVKSIELGAQSLDDEVLLVSKRGHSADDVRRAARLITERGFTLGLQMMTGLPCDALKKCLDTAKEFVLLGAKETRIYPTVVIKGTRLSEMYEKGEYAPPGVEESVEWAAACYEVFFENKVTVLRIGLQNSDELKKNAVAGAYHDALGEKVLSRVVRRAAENAGGGEIVFSPGFLSKVVGQKKENMLYFEKKGIKVTLSTDKSAAGVKVNGKYVLTI